MNLALVTSIRSKLFSLAISLSLKVIFSLNLTLSVLLIYFNYKLAYNIRTLKEGYYTLITLYLLFAFI